MLFKELTKVVAGNNLIERSKKMFWEVLQIYQQEDPKEFTENFDNYDKRKVSIYVNNVSFLVHNWPSDAWCCVVVSINIIYNGKNVGYHDIHYSLDGEIDDDFFVTYGKKGENRFDSFRKKGLLAPKKMV